MSNYFRRKRKMKKTLALLLCLAMLFTALSVNVFAVENPSVTIVTNSVSAEGDTSFAIKLTGFESLKGLDMTVTATGDIEMLSASALNFKDSDSDEIIEIAEGTDYVISEDGRTLDIVGLQKDVTGDIITVAAKVTGTATIAVTACDLAKSAEELYAEAEIAPATITYATSSEVEVGNKEVVEQADAGEGYFIPYGAVYNGTADDPEYLKKDDEGKFVVSANTTVKKFPIPANGFGTYGVSDGTYRNSDTKQFGNYVDGYDPENKTYGTFAIVGDWSEYRDWYLKNKGYSDAELVKKLYNSYINRIDTEEEGKHCYKAYGIDADKNGEAEYVIQIIEVEQTKYLWRNDTQLEYGVRFVGLYDDKDYAAVAMYKKGDATEFATQIKVD